MIVHLEKEEQRKARRQLLSDVVYIISHEALKEQKKEGNTALAPVEVLLSARSFCQTLMDLPDPLEGLADEIEDLEDEAQGEHDAMLIMLMTAVQLQALSKRMVGIDTRAIIARLFEHIGDNILFLTLIGQFTHKEGQLWMEEKKVDLLKYEMKEIMQEGGSVEEIRSLINEMITFATKIDSESMKGFLLFLHTYNAEHNYAYTKEIQVLQDALSNKNNRNTIVQGDWVGNKYVNNEIPKVEKGGTGFVINGKE